MFYVYAIGVVIVRTCCAYRYGTMVCSKILHDNTYIGVTLYSL